jgi:phosphoglycerate dehydrogenase-like enzyme
MNVLLSTGSFKFSEQQIEKLRQIKDVTLWMQDDERKPILYDLSKVDYLATFNLLKEHNVDKYTRLKYVQSMSAGLDIFPLEKLKERNIPIINASGVYSVAISEFVIMRILQIYKQTRFFEKNQKVGAWKKSHNLLTLTDKRVAIIGYGDIGSNVAKRLSAFDAKIISINRSEKNDAYIDEHYHISKLNDVVSTCDIVVICAPHTEQTHELFNDEVFSAMKDTSVLVNIARGKLINENDLIKHLDAGRFLGVALDVTYDEPLLKTSKLWGYDNVYMSPHNSYYSDMILDNLFKYVYNNLIAYSKGER